MYNYDMSYFRDFAAILAKQSHEPISLSANRQLYLNNSLMIDNSPLEKLSLIGSRLVACPGYDDGI
jgi:hypothetical protein